MTMQQEQKYKIFLFGTEISFEMIWNKYNFKMILKKVLSYFYVRKLEKMLILKADVKDYY